MRLNRDAIAGIMLDALGLADEPWYERCLEAADALIYAEGVAQRGHDGADVDNVVGTAVHDEEINDGTARAR